MAHAAQAERRRFSVVEVYRMVEAGILAEHEHVELLDGELCTMSPQGPARSAFTAELGERLRAALGERLHLRHHSPLRVSEWDLPEPDIAVVRGAARDYRDRLPTPADVSLVVEITASSQRRDARKASIYARGGVSVYWIVDLEHASITEHTDPAAEGYRRIRTLAGADLVDVPGAEASWIVAELFA